MRLAVVLHVPAVLGDRYDHGFSVRCYRQGSVDCRDRVVVSLGVVVQRVGEPVRAVTDCRLAAGHTVGRAFAFREAVACHCHGAVRQSCPVVHLLIRRAGQCYVPLGDRQGTARRAHRELRSHVIAGDVSHHRRTDHVQRIVARVGTGRGRGQSFHCVGVAFDYELGVN